MLSVKFTNVPFVAKLVNQLNQLVSIASWEFSARELTVIEFDSTLSSLTLLKLKADAYELWDYKFPAKKKGAIILGFQTKSLVRILQCGSQNDTLTITAKADDPDRAIFTFKTAENAVAGALNSIDLGLVFNDSDFRGIPEHEVQVKMTMTSKKFFEMIKSFGAKTGYARFIVSADGSRFTMKNTKNEISVTNQEVEIEAQSAVDNIFGLRFLVPMSKAYALASSVEITLFESGEAGMVQFTFFFPNAAGTLMYYLAGWLPEEMDKDEGKEEEEEQEEESDE
jgi:proliferating cell nuclear antigen PCNA